MMREISFLHIPKTGGSSIRAALVGRKVGGGGHQRARSAYWRRQVDGGLRVTWVRHPWERLVSLHSWLGDVEENLERVNGNAMMRVYSAYARELDCDEFWRRFDFETADAVTNFFRPMGWFLDGVRFDFVGRFENFEEDWKRLQEVSGVKRELGHSNRSFHGSWENVLSEETRVNLRRRFERDFLDFDYEIDG